VGTRLFSSKNENLSPLISSLKRGTLLGGCVETPSYDDIREGGRSFGEESPDPQLVSQSIDYLVLDKYLSKTYLFNIE
jgi:hypothetical protein